MWVNGHEWAKRQATRAGLEFTALANGFATCEQPEQLQAICDGLGPVQIQAFFDRWMARVPTPLDDFDRDGGYWWELSMRQIEVSRTIVLDQPRRARAFFESVVADNLDIGRRDELKIIFDRDTNDKPCRRIANTSMYSYRVIMGTDPFHLSLPEARHDGRDQPSTVEIRRSA